MSEQMTTGPLEVVTALPDESIMVADDSEQTPHHTGEQLAAMMQSIEPFLGRNISRRMVLRTGKAICQLAAVSTALHYVEQPIMDNVYGQHDTKLIYSGTDIKLPVANAGLVSQGWGITRSSSIVTALLHEDVYTDDFPFAAYRCSSKGISKESIENCGRKFVDFLNPKQADVHAVSEGLMIALTGARAAGRHLRLVSSHDSPADINDAYHATLAKGLALANELGVYHGGILGKVATCLVEEVDREGFHEIFTGWFRAIHSALTGGDPRMMVSEISFMEQTDLLRDWRSFRHIINSDTQVVIMRTKEAHKDRVVKDIQAADKLQEMYANLGATAVVIEVDESGHANTNVGIATGAAHLKRILADAA